MSLVNQQLVESFAGKQVFLTGHTGFKGAWLAHWLTELGAKVTGYALQPEQASSLFEQLELSQRLYRSEIADIRDSVCLQDCLLESEPDFVFHLAAQPLVRRSYLQPVETYDVNVMGSLYLLEGLRQLSKPCAAVFITTDKCYENEETGRRYRESDALGGHDPYSSSKACAELVIASMRRSFFLDSENVRIASARAGNVIGGGDWAEDRIVPDAMRSLAAGAAIEVRNPSAVRPWQHVLEPLHGYLRLAQALVDEAVETPVVDYCSAFNFGPSDDANQSVGVLVDEILKSWPGSWRDCSDPDALHEAHLLHLDISKAQALLNWQPVWGLGQSVQATVEWYRQMREQPADIIDFTSRQIARFCADADQLAVDL